MRSNPTLRIPLLQRVAFLILAFSVFGFGLQARLAQYKPYPPNPTATKIATERPSTAVLKAILVLKNDLNPRTCFRFAFSRTHFRSEPARSVIDTAEIELSSPVRFDLKGAYFLHRPPPVRS